MVNRALPDVPVERGARCEIVRVHLLAFPQLLTRFRARLSIGPISPGGGLFRGWGRICAANER